VAVIETQAARSERTLTDQRPLAIGGRSAARLARHVKQFADRSAQPIRNKARVSDSIGAATASILPSRRGNSKQPPLREGFKWV
jgi:hypothetical protein